MIQRNAEPIGHISPYPRIDLSPVRTAIAERHGLSAIDDSKRRRGGTSKADPSGFILLPFFIIAASRSSWPARTVQVIEMFIRTALRWLERRALLQGIYNRLSNSCIHLL